MELGPELLEATAAFAKVLDEAKSKDQPPGGWYPYGSLANMWHLDRLLPVHHRDLSMLTAGGPVADVGAADGDMAYFLSSLGIPTEIIDNATTNFNNLEGASLLGRLLHIELPIHSIDLDAQFSMPHTNYSLILFLGILYHLENPYYALKAMSRHSHYLLLSTRIAAQTLDGQVALDKAPVAYLVDPHETNDDPTNFWIFSMPGLRRLVSRCGWEIVSELQVGRTDGDSNPSQADRDERAFMLLRSRS